MFQLPSGEAAAEGQTDDTAIPLHDVTRREFESLLAFLYNSMHEDGKLTLPQWIDLLSMSTRFVCDKIRERAIKEIHQHRPRIDPVEKIVLSVKFEVPQWLTPSYEAICQRSQPLDITETIRLGLATAVLLMRAREILRQDVRSRDGRVKRRAPSPPHTATSASWPGLTVADEEPLFDADRVSEVVRNVFALPADA
ncbi:uncharacterized protein LAESUDRAFT_727582 [Laetiporus sulphureus 93-53]|uniref:BTB domain-containing protein n=1 Tax=Laetiporus sulphureus 93-53 TaxID=1314785 RepID=A0A165DJ78_9APHY|nr:uncharacterized protein LAESUDRAFT_727582 [Laetiporus sulphureus 93-53]KZT05001.1 hypothetical protein LAESUDRAFT_727582 [Laetiporus sulphureus 93-53]